MKTTIKAILFCSIGLMLSCNQARPGQNTTDEGTQQSESSVNSDMENNRTASDVDTLVSPGSNAIDHEEGKTAPTESRQTETQTGTGSDPNMQGQSATHGRDTKAGNK